MIEIKVTGMCKGCPFIDPKFSKVATDEYGDMWFARCVHQEPCKRIKRMLKQKEENEE